MELLHSTNYEGIKLALEEERKMMIEKILNLLTERIFYKKRDRNM